MDIRDRNASVHDLSFSWSAFSSWSAVEAEGRARIPKNFGRYISGQAWSEFRQPMSGMRYDAGGSLCFSFRFRSFAAFGHKSSRVFVCDMSLRSHMESQHTTSYHAIVPPLLKPGSCAQSPMINTIGSRLAHVPYLQILPYTTLSLTRLGSRRPWSRSARHPLRQT